MIAAGILDEDERVELIDGVIVEMTPIGDVHASCVLRLNHLLNARLQGRAWVQVQGPIRLHADDPSRPEPDLTVVRPREDYYRRERPRADDILVVIEVADISAERDRRIKLPKYARAGIGESWWWTSGQTASWWAGTRSLAGATAARWSCGAGRA